MGSFSSLLVRFFTSPGFRASLLHPTVAFFLHIFYHRHRRTPLTLVVHARHRTPGYNSIKSPVFQTLLHPLNVAVRVCRQQDRFDIRSVGFPPSNSSCA